MVNRLAQYDQVFHALADSSRRSMVERLTHGTASVSELAQPLSMTLAAVVQHLGVLEAAGIVDSEKVGRVRVCQLAPQGLKPAEGWLATQRTQWERRLDRLGELLTAPDDDDELPLHTQTTKEDS
jgi:DNA-binding transcriptional ArsR family regulator